MSDLVTAVQEIREHADAYRLAGDYYEGNVAELFVSPTVRRALRNAVGGFDLNLARRAVDAVLDRMVITAVHVPNDEGAMRALVDTVWTPNRMHRYAKQVHWAALTYGDAYLIVWPGEDDGTVEMHYNSPVSTRVFYDPENPRVKSHAAKMWTIGARDQIVTRVNLFYADRIEKWTTKPGSRACEDVDFIPYEEDGADWPLVNDTGQVPVFHFRTADPYGRPEHRGAFGPQNALTKLSATLMATIDYQGWPQRYALMNEGSEELADWDDDDTANPNEAESSLKATPGGLWKLPGTSKVGQFDPANIDAFLKPAGFYIRAMAAATATPLRFFDPQGQIPSGEALRADDAPLAMRIIDREEWLTEEWSEALRYAGQLAGISLLSVDVRWRPVQIVDDLTGWQTVAQKIAAPVGVPREVALVEAGYPSDVVAGWPKPPPVPVSPAPLGSAGA